MRQAEFWEKAEDGAVVCNLCPHRCRIAEGRRGRCRVRENQGGELVPLTWGRPASVAMDPIEKKPLYHFHPGRQILSLGTWGCNFSCSFCQNADLSQSEVRTREVKPEDVAGMVRSGDSVGIAYTYNEPLIWYEYVADCAALMRQSRLKNVLVTNGYVNPEPLEKLLPLIDALNIDIKSIRDEFYQKLCGGSVAPVLEAAKLAATSAHVEITNLIIPGQNDQPGQVGELAGWMAENLGPNTPLHLSGYIPRYQLKARPTTDADLLAAREEAREHLTFVYVGNLVVDHGGTTKCPSCGAVVIDRQGYATRTDGLAGGGTCAACGADCHVVD